MTNKIREEYFEWLCDKVCGNRYKGQVYNKLLTYLYNKEFRYSLVRDGNRAEDGIDLRYRFGVSEYLDGPCSILEMMIALAIRCERTIMDDPRVGDRTDQWFWQMIVNLGLGPMRDSVYDEQYVDDIVERFLNRDYSPDGAGGLFRISDCEYDLRGVEIWSQLCWYLDKIDSDY